MFSLVGCVYTSSLSGSGNLILTGKAFSPRGCYSRHPEQVTLTVAEGVVLKLNHSKWSIPGALAIGMLEAFHSCSCVKPNGNPKTT